MGKTPKRRRGCFWSRYASTSRRSMRSLRSRRSRVRALPPRIENARHERHEGDERDVVLRSDASWQLLAGSETNRDHYKKKTKTILKFLYSLDNIARRPKLYSTARVTADDPINNIRVRSRHRRHSRHTKPSHQPTLLLLFF